MTTTKWIVFDAKTAKRIKTVTIKHQSNLLYIELDPFDEELKKKGLGAHAYDSVNQNYLKGKPFKEKLICLGWQFKQIK